MLGAHCWFSADYLLSLPLILETNSKMNMKKMILAALFGIVSMVVANAQVPGGDGNKYVPYEQRTGNESVVYFTRNLSAEGLIKAYEQVCDHISGHVGVKLHTGEPNGPNIIPRE